MNSGRRLFALILCALLGVALVVLGYAEVIDPYWGGVGTAMVAVLLVRIVKMYRFHKNAEYREKVEVEIADERNRFLRSRAWAIAGYLFIVIAGVASIAFMALGQELLSLAAGCATCLVALLYWGAYLVLRKKY